MGLLGCQAKPFLAIGGLDHGKPRLGQESAQKVAGHLVVVHDQDALLRAICQPPESIDGSGGRLLSRASGRLGLASWPSPGPLSPEPNEVTAVYSP